MKALTPSSPHVLIMVGIPGSGKSSFAERFAETFQAPILNIGKLKNELNLNLPELLKLRDLILPELTKGRRTILIEGETDSKKDRLTLISSLVKEGYNPLIIWVQTEPNEARRRALKKYPAGSGLSSEEFDNLVKTFQPPTTQEKCVVISGKHTYATQLKVVLKQIAQNADRTVNAGSTSKPLDRPRGRNIVLR